LHELDLTRKHRRLVTVFGASEAMIFNNNTSGRDFQISPARNGFQDNSIIATGAIHASERNLTLKLQICFAEPFIISTKPLTETIYDFASMARSIIELFDGP